MELLLTPEEARVLGVLVEKQITTPDYYPMTLNALVAACNQKSNRNPVTAYDEREVVRALDGLSAKKLSLLHHVAGGRVPKYEHRLEEMFAFSEEQQALICLLLLRGAQTPGELKGRSGRLCPFSTPGEVENVLGSLSAWEDGALVVQLPLRPGSREHRYAHLLCGELELLDEESVAPPSEPARQQLEAEKQRFTALEEEVAALREELAELREQFNKFREEFE